MPQEVRRPAAKKAKKKVAAKKPAKKAGAKTPPRRAAVVTGSVTVIKAEKLNKLLLNCLSYQNVISDNSGSMGGLISAAAENDNLHKGAFGTIKKLYMMAKKGNSAKLAEWLFHFDAMRERAEIDKLAGSSMLPGMKKDGPKKPATDDEKDLRPRHLRQPGASAAAAADDILNGGKKDPVQSAADRAEAQTKDKLGEGGDADNVSRIH